MFPPEQSLELFKSFFGTDNVHEAAFAPGPDRSVKLKDAHIKREVPIIPVVKVALEDVYNKTQIEASYTKKVFVLRRDVNLH